ncbi:ABC transporter ATP-binding protein [Roseovarius phycicola]|uniref:ABC transporter ATP-binding protein n=1 Tax=Roseovarius phycicola TaxID=3080976 RepID=A0ABZ2HLZ9_9RHOB
MLELRKINSGYGAAQVLRDVSLSVAPGEILCLMGRNGAGKTTTMQTIMGLLPLMSGEVLLDGKDVGKLPPHEVPRAGIGYIPQGRRLFTGLTVAQNLEVGLQVRNSDRAVLDGVLELFPRLRERMDQPAQTLSGGEQQMLATARALCIEPKVLLLDEPTEGLQPSMIEAIRQVVVKMREAGVAILLVEQRIEAVLSVADRVAFIENGRNGETMTVEALRAEPSIIDRYVGV